MYLAAKLVQAKAPYTVIPGINKIRDEVESQIEEVGEKLKEKVEERVVEESNEKTPSAINVKQDDDGSKSQVTGNAEEDNQRNLGEEILQPYQ